MNSRSVAARVYVEGAPVIRLVAEESPVPGEMRDPYELALEALTHGAVLEGLTVEGERVAIPASRIIDVVKPALGTAEEDQRNAVAAMAFLRQKGNLAAARNIAGDTFVEGYLSEAAFGSTVRVLLVDGDEGEIAGYMDGVFTISSGRAEQEVPLTGIQSVLDWDVELGRHGGKINGEPTEALAELLASNHYGNG